MEEEIQKGVDQRLIPGVVLVATNVDGRVKFL
jgi:hypothetical protein